ncbi:MAG TPA: glycosyltransferase, partial [Candidatus Deferrimicrobiaceae bacterium]
MTGPPLVSIVIPVYNGADFLREAIDSALAQTYPDVEVVVVDDGSNDGGETEAIARSCGERIRYIRKPNGGVASALNSGIREMRGKYFCWLSHDDVFLPRKVALQVARMEAEGGDVVLYSDYEIIDGAGRPRGGFRAGELPPVPFRRALVADMPVNGCTVMAPKRLLERAGLFDERLRTTQDVDLWFRMAPAC